MSYKIAFFDAKDYDRNSFIKASENREFEIAYYETRLTESTCRLAEGCDAVCVFVNDDINRNVIDALVEMKVKLIALRCAGYNNVDVEYAYQKIHIVRVPAYSRACSTKSAFPTISRRTRSGRLPTPASGASTRGRSETTPI